MASTLDFEAPLMRLQEEITRLRGEADGGNADAAGKVAKGTAAMTFMGGRS